MAGPLIDPTAASDLTSRLSDIRSRLAGEMGEVAPVVDDVYTNLKNSMMSIDPNVDTSGVPNAEIRYGLSRMDTPQEREAYLTEKVGDGWGLDSYGNYVINPEGMESLGLSHSGKPVRIDEPTLTKYDLSDIGGDAPALAGAVGTAVLTGGTSLIAQAALVAGGAMIGKTIGETVEEINEENSQEFMDVVKDVGLEGLYAFGGEAFTRGILSPIGRKLMAPEAKRMTPESIAITREAEAVGVKPKSTQITGAPILGRMESMIDNIFGDPNVIANTKAMNAEIARLSSVPGHKLASKFDVGEIVKSDISAARKGLSEWAEEVSLKIDGLTGGHPVIPTQKLKDAADGLIKDLPMDANGVPIFTSKELLSQIKAIQGMGDSVTVSQMQRITNKLWEAVDDNTVIPGLSSRDSKELWKAAVSAYDDAGVITTKGGTVALKNAEEIRGAIGAFRRKYKDEIKQFDNSLVKRIMADESSGGHIPPERVVDSLFKKGSHTPLKRIMGLVTDDTKARIQQIAMDDILLKISRRTDDPLTDVFAGRGFLNNLDNYGRPALNAMFGKRTVGDLYRLGRVVSLATQRMKLSGGIVAANIALHPWKNIGKLVQLNLLSRLMTSEKGLQYLTVGIRAPKTRAGTKALSDLVVLSQQLLDEHVKENVSGE